MNFPILSSLIVLPTIGAIFLLFSKDKNSNTGKYVALFTSFVNFLISIYLWYLFDSSTSNFQFAENREWFKDFVIGHGGENNFWGESIKFLIPLSTDHPPLWIILITPILVLLSIPIAYYLFVKNKELPNQIVQSNRPLYNFLVNKWYFDELYDIIFIQSSKKIGLFFWKTIDIKIIDRFGPDGLSLLIKNLSLRASKFQSGFIYQYAFMILIGLSALLTFLILH